MKKRPIIMHIFRQTALLATLFFLQTVAAAQTHADQIRADLLNPATPRVMVASHRSDWRNFPKNSLEGIESAIGMGVDIIELDLQRTRDGQLILMHDSKLDRTTTGRGRVVNWTLDSIRTLRLKNGCAIKTIHRVPTLEEALTLCQGRIMINLDKAFDYFDQVYALLQKTGTTAQIIMKSDAPAEQVQAKYGKYLIQVIFMPKVNLDAPDAMVKLNDYLRILKPAVIEFKFANDTNRLPFEVKQRMAGTCRIWYNTLWSTHAGGHDDDRSLIDLQAGYGYLIDTLGCSVLQTDRPARLIEFLHNKQTFTPQNMNKDWTYLTTQNEYQTEKTTNIRVAEAFLKGKHLPADNEDGMLVTNHYAAVIDGATAKSPFRYQNKATGRLAMEIALDAIRNFPPNLTADQAVKRITEAIHNFYVKHNLLSDVEANPANRFTANGVIFSLDRREIWQVGDCQCLAGNIYSSNEKEIDAIMANARAAYNEVMLLNGETEKSLLAHDLGRDFIQPFLAKQSILQNHPDTTQRFAFLVLDGFLNNMKLVNIFSLPATVHTIVLTSDGYPHIFGTLQETEAYLAEILAEDPLCMCRYKSTKGIKQGNNSFDDRAYLRIEF